MVEKEIISKIRKYFEMNESENTSTFGEVLLWRRPEKQGYIWKEIWG